MVKIQTTNVAMSQEELDQLEKDNPLEAFDFLDEKWCPFL